jgi:hypothetical protein
MFFTLKRKRTRYRLCEIWGFHGGEDDDDDDYYYYYVNAVWADLVYLSS